MLCMWDVKTASHIFYFIFQCQTVSPRRAWCCASEAASIVAKDNNCGTWHEHMYSSETMIFVIEVTSFCIQITKRTFSYSPWGTEVTNVSTLANFWAVLKIAFIKQSWVRNVRIADWTNNNRTNTINTSFSPYTQNFTAAPSGWHECQISSPISAARGDRATQALRRLVTAATSLWSMSMSSDYIGEHKT